MSTRDLLLDKAQRSFRAAERLAAAGDFDFAASRAYYGCFYVAQALLLANGLRFSSHGQVIAQYGLHFAKTARLAPRFHRLLDLAFSTRQLADYQTEVTIQAEVVAQLVGEGWSFLEAARSYLREVSFPEEEKEL